MSFFGRKPLIQKVCVILCLFTHSGGKAVVLCVTVYVHSDDSKEDVEKCKQRDLLEQLLKEMTGEFPALSQVFVEERDIYLTHSLKMAARPREYPDKPESELLLF